ncbi:hypothetical protein HNP55_001261 [Paucibacter oligotrophus]|uniref:Uncharacterized protein n=1 Tax=Roseateles oligotrophus TaxID=1769250 RepID=A0A840L459_9BURK|nr:hypothetical protein [Roseateles oligotrophus]MBB4842746.1 hypothetical protein [Roseateles oligotrophus]
MSRPASRRRSLGLLTALALTLLATWWAASSEDQEDLARPSAAAQRSAAPPPAARRDRPAEAKAREAEAAAPSWAPVQRQAWAEVPERQFAAWAPPPPPPPPKIVAAPSTPPPPMAPPFPYQLIGRLVEGSKAQGLLAGPNRSLAVQVGDVVDGQWRVDQIHERGLNLTWLPAQLPQIIAFRPTSP